MSDAMWFFIVIVGLFVLRGVAATIIFFYLLPDDDRCPHCDAPTLYVQSRGWNTLLPWFRTSWCPECRWDGMLRKKAQRRAGPPVRSGHDTPTAPPEGSREGGPPRPR